jgi:hypothetical protein
MVLKFAPAQACTKRVQDGARDTLTWEALIGKVRTGPAALMRPFDKGANTAEYFVHREDLRRGQPGSEPRMLAPEDETVLWGQLGRLRTGALLSSSFRRTSVTPRPSTTRLGRCLRSNSKLPRGGRRGERRSAKQRGRAGPGNKFHPTVVSDPCQGGELAALPSPERAPVTAKHHD